MPSISESDIVAEVDAIVAEYGTNHNAKCMYFDARLMYKDNDMVGQGYRVIPEAEAADITPVCIIGHLIKRLEPDSWAKLVNGGWCGVEVRELRDEGLRLKLVEDPEMARALSVLQGEQDRGETWGRARDRFKRELNVS